MQFNYQIQINYISDSMHYRNTTNTSGRFLPVAHSSCVQYKKELHTGGMHHFILQALFLVLDRDTTTLDTYYYISITNEVGCKFYDIFGFHSTTVTQGYTIEISLRNKMTFYGPVVYFQSMYYRIDIATPLQKSCDAVLSFQLVFENKSKSTFSQGHCAMDYIQVSLRVKIRQLL